MNDDSFKSFEKILENDANKKIVDRLNNPEQIQETKPSTGLNNNHGSIGLVPFMISLVFILLGGMYIAYILMR